MSNRIFIDRSREMKVLEDLIDRKGTHLIPIYGRRRIGKTSLVRELIRKRGGIYHLCTGAGVARNLEMVSGIVSERLSLPRLKIDSFSEVFRILKDSGYKGIVALDEFPYLVNSSEGILGEFQSVMDDILLDSGIVVILCGSSIGMMENYVLSFKSPLFGRRAGQLEVGPIPRTNLKEFLPSYGNKELLAVDAIAGGVPRYLMEFESFGSLDKTLNESFFRPEGYMNKEAYLLLREELRDPDVYITILEEMASGRTKLTDIANASYIPAKDMSKYLAVLQRIGIVKREQPVTEGRNNSKRSYYRISDPYFRFYFRFVNPSRDRIEMLETERLEEIWKAHLNDFISPFVEELAREMLIRELGCSKAGRWWYKGEEIDCVGFDTRTGRAVFCEVKWKSKSIDRTVLDDLVRKSKLVELKGIHDRKYLIVSKSGFSGTLLDAAEGNDGIVLMDEESLTTSIYGRSDP